jgi:hypothetical protein
VKPKTPIGSFLSAGFPMQTTGSPNTAIHHYRFISCDKKQRDHTMKARPPALVLTNGKVITLDSRSSIVDATKLKGESPKTPSPDNGPFRLS